MVSVTVYFLQLLAMKAKQQRRKPEKKQYNPEDANYGIEIVAFLRHVLKEIKQKKTD